MRFVIVSGPPGAGKTTLAAALAPRLGLPLIAKDTIKEAMGEVLDDGTPEGSARLGRASFEVLFAIAAQCPRAVLEANFLPLSAATLRRLDPEPVELFCRCPLDLCHQRFAERQASGARHLVHPPEVPALDVFTRSDAPLAIGPVREIRTDGPVDLDDLVAWVRSVSPAAAPFVVE